jgi:uncharacterized membrane protein YhaH (DUF805 family)
MFDVFSSAFAFHGRIGRASYWGLSIVCLLALFASSVSVALTANATNASPVNVVAVAVAIVGAAIFLVASMVLFGTGVCRLHDRGRSGFWIILYYAVPFILAVLAMEPEGRGTALDALALAIMVWVTVDLGLLKGGTADNRYGPAGRATA